MNSNSNSSGVILIGCFCLLVVLVFKTVTISEFVHFIVIMATVVFTLALTFLVGFCLAVKVILDTTGIFLKQANALRTTLTNKKILAMPLNSIVWLLTGKDSVVLLDLYIDQINKFHHDTPAPREEVQTTGSAGGEQINQNPTNVHNVVSPPAGRLKLPTVQERQKYRTKLLEAVKANNAPEIQRLYDTVEVNINYVYGDDSWVYHNLGYTSVNMTLLHHACYYGHIQAVKKLIELGANVNASDINGATPMHIAIRRGHTECETILGAQDDIDLHIVDNAKPIGRTALSYRNVGAAVAPL